MVREAARAIEHYVYDQTMVLGRTDISAIEQEIFKKFIAPIHLLDNGDAWIYAPDHVVFDQSEDFPDEYRGKSMAEIFAIQEHYGASHFEEMTTDVSVAREGVGYYIWLPEKGPEIAAWTPVRVGEYTWTIGLSTPLTEILAATGATSQIALSTTVIVISIIVGLILLLIWLYSDIRRKKVETKLMERETQFREIYNNTNDAIHIHAIMEDGRPGNFIDVNDIACRMLQYTKEEFRSHTPLDFATDYHNPPLEHILHELETKGNAQFETEHVRKDGLIIPVEISSHVTTLQNKKVIIGVVLDITERKKAENELQKAYAERGALLSEIHHRVNNNLQVLLSMMTLQEISYHEELATNTLAKKIFSDMEKRIRAIALVHENLYQSGELTGIHLHEYLYFLAEEILNSEIGRVYISYTVEGGDEVVVPMDQAVLLSLTASEILTNSLKYAFSEKKQGNVKILISEEPEHLCIDISDDGIGLPAGTDLRTGESVGLSIIYNVVTVQLGGTIELVETKGTSYNIRIPGNFRSEP